MIDFFPDLQQQLNKLSIYKKPMQFQITEIELDFEDSQGVLSHEEQNEIVDDLVGHIWEADDEDDLIEEITCATGWSVNSIDFRYPLNAS